jgi:hypothetical protein
MSNHIESYDRVVRSIYLNKAEINLLLTRADVFDPAACREVVRHLSQEYGAEFIGYLYGAIVFQSEMVPEWHAIIFQDGIIARIIDPTAALPLGDTQ